MLNYFMNKYICFIKILKIKYEKEKATVIMKYCYNNSKIPSQVTYISTKCSNKEAVTVFLYLISYD